MGAGWGTEAAASSRRGRHETRSRTLPPYLCRCGRTVGVSSEAGAIRMYASEIV